MVRWEARREDGKADLKGLEGHGKELEFYPKTMEENLYVSNITRAVGMVRGARGRGQVEVYQGY